MCIDLSQLYILTVRIKKDVIKNGLFFQAIFGFTAYITTMTPIQAASTTAIRCCMTSHSGWRRERTSSSPLSAAASASSSSMPRRPATIMHNVSRRPDIDAIQNASRTSAALRFVFINSCRPRTLSYKTFLTMAFCVYMTTRFRIVPTVGVLTHHLTFMAYWSHKG